MEALNSLKIILLIVFLLFFIYVLNPNAQKPEKKQKKKTERTPLTKEQLREYKGLEHISDKEAENIIYSFKKYSELTYKLFQEERTNRIII